jgi:hypothetical protein
LTIDRDEWLAELEKLGALDQSGEGMTRQEIADAIGRCTRWVSDKLRLLAARGKLIVGRREMVGLDGRRCRVPVYSIRK